MPVLGLSLVCQLELLRPIPVLQLGLLELIPVGAFPYLEILPNEDYAVGADSCFAIQSVLAYSCFCLTVFCCYLFLFFHPDCWG